MTTRLFAALRLAYGARLLSTGSISRGVRLPTLPQRPDPALPALDATTAAPAGADALADALVAQPAPPPTPPAADPSSDSGGGITSQLLADLERSGRIHKETLALMEGAPEWQGYESNVNFDLNVLRMRYAATPDVPMTPARRAQMQAHLRAAQAQVMEQHATAAARKFVDSLAPREVALLRDMVGRLDTPGSGAPMAAAAQAAAQRPGSGNSEAERFQARAEGVRDALWTLSSILGKAEGKKGPKG